MGDNGICPNSGAISDNNTGKNRDPSPNPHFIAYDNWARDMAGIAKRDSLPAPMVRITNARILSDH